MGARGCLEVLREINTLQIKNLVEKLQQRH